MSENVDDKVNISVQLTRNGELHKVLQRSSENQSQTLRDSLREYKLRGDLDVDKLIQETLSEAEDIDFEEPQKSVEYWQSELEENEKELHRVEGKIEELQSSLPGIKEKVAMQAKDKSELQDTREKLESLKDLRVQLKKNQDELKELISTVKDERDRREKLQLEAELLALEDDLTAYIAENMTPALEDLEHLLNGFQTVVEEMNARRRELGKTQKRHTLFYKLIAQRLDENTELPIETPGFRNNTGGHNPAQETPLQMLNPPESPDQSRSLTAIENMRGEENEANGNE